MFVTCICFGKFRDGVPIQTQPFIDEKFKMDTLPNHTKVEVEDCLYNDNFFKIKFKEQYIITWHKETSGLIDYAYDRSYLKRLKRKEIEYPQHETVSKKPKEDFFSELEFVDHYTMVNHFVEKECRPETTVTEKIGQLNIVEEPKTRRTRYKKERIPATVRNIVWVTHFQESKKGVCWLCKVEDISSANFECGHVISERNGGKCTIDNLRPICSFCNKSVGTMNMEDFKKKYNIK